MRAKESRLFFTAREDTGGKKDPYCDRGEWIYEDIGVNNSWINYLPQSYLDYWKQLSWQLSKQSDPDHPLPDITAIYLNDGKKAFYLRCLDSDWRVFWGDHQTVGIKPLGVSKNNPEEILNESYMLSMYQGSNKNKCPNYYDRWLNDIELRYIIQDFSKISVAMNIPKAKYDMGQGSVGFKDKTGWHTCSIGGIFAKDFENVKNLFHQMGKRVLDVVTFPEVKNILCIIQKNRK